SVDQLTPTGEVLGCWCGLWCRLASHCPEVIAEMGEAVNPVVLDVPPGGGGVVATVERRAGQSVCIRGISAEVFSQHGGDSLHQAGVGRVCATVGVHGVYQPD